EFREFSKKKKGFRNDVKRVLVHESKKVFHEIITEDEASGKKVKYSEFCEAERVLNILKYAQFRKIETEDNEEDWEYTEVIVGDPAEEFEDAEYREIPLEGSGKVVEDAEYREIPLEGSGKVVEDAEYHAIPLEGSGNVVEDAEYSEMDLPERDSGKGKVSSNSSLVDLLINTLSVVEKETQNRYSRGKKHIYSYDKNKGRGGVQHSKDNNNYKYIYNKPYWQKKKKEREMSQRIDERKKTYKKIKKNKKKEREKRGIQRNGKKKKKAIYINKKNMKKKAERKEIYNVMVKIKGTHYLSIR